MKAKNIFKFFIYLLLGIMIVPLNSCKEEFFELDSPPISEIKTVGDLELLINYPYKNTFLSSNGSGEYVISSMTHFVHLMMSDMVRVINVNSGFSTGQLYNRQTDQLVPQVTNTYANAYNTISACNYIIDFIEKQPFPNASAEQVTKNINRVKGEALFLRAFTYFYLAQLFCPPYDPSGNNDTETLVLRLKFADDLNTAMNNSPVPTSAIYAQIETDFKQAKELLPLEWVTGMPEAYKFGRATRHAAMFYLARTLLHKGNYTEALTELESIVNDPQKPRKLSANLVSLFENNNVNGIGDPEVILYGFYVDPLRASLRHQVQFHYFYNKTFSDPSLFRTPWVVSFDNSVLFKCKIMDRLDTDRQLTAEWTRDKRSKLYYSWKGADPSLPIKNPTNKEYITGEAFVPYIGKKDAILMGDKYFRVPKYQNIPFVRIAEVYILIAAIKAYQNDGSGAAVSLNLVRKRSWDETLSGPFVPLASATFEDVDCEWIKELAFESDRISFLQMFRKPIGPAERQTAPVEAPYPNFYWRLPLSETDFNSPK